MLYSQEKKMEAGVCLGTEGMYSKICAHTCERKGKGVTEGIPSTEVFYKTWAQLSRYYFE